MSGPQLSQDVARWSAPMAALQAGVSFRQLDHWCRYGGVSSAVGANGSGSRRQFTSHEVWKLCVIGVIVRWFVANTADPRRGIATEQISTWWKLLDEPDALIDLSDGPVTFTVDPRRVVPASLEALR